MRATYNPKGAALEYGDLAVNLFTGCPHACAYCYAPAVLRRRTVEQVAEFHSRVELRRGVLEQIRKDAWRMERIWKERPGDRPNVFLCFTCDPYPRGHAVLSEATRQAIKLYNASGFGVTILTKGGLTAERDFDLMEEFPANRFGVTMTFNNLDDSLAWEPGAADPLERVQSLVRAKLSGVRTWVSMEPVIDPDQTIDLIRIVHDVADEIHVGRLNHMPEASGRIDYRAFLREARSTLESLGFSRQPGAPRFYRIKNDLARVA